jgi:TRAP-type C4-dicarboxylate transport system substrate-binding protein
MSEDYLIMSKLLTLQNIDVYELLSEDERQIVTYVISKAMARNYGVIEHQDFNYDIKGEIL